MPPITDLQTLLSGMKPVLNPGRYVFATVPPGKTLPPGDIVSSIREAEGLSVVVESKVAEREGLEVVFSCAWITLEVHSDLTAIGLTAAFAEVLAKAGISCNVVAGAHHDHLFVPYSKAESALNELHNLQHGAAKPSGQHKHA